MTTGGAVGSMRRQSNYGSGGEDRPEFIRCVDRRQPQTHEVLTYREDGVTPEVYPTASGDFGTFIGGFFYRLS